MVLSSLIALLPLAAPRAYNAYRRCWVTVVGSPAVEGVIRSSFDRFVLERWALDTNGHRVASLGQSGYATKEKAEKARAAWLAMHVEEVVA
jgi:hypothetical protein